MRPVWNSTAPLRSVGLPVALAALTVTLIAMPAAAQTPAASQAPAPAQPAQSSASAASLFAFGGEAVAASSYVWRGFPESDHVCFQPDAWISVGPVSLEAWMNLEAVDGRLHNAEYDLIVMYTREFPHATVAGGLANYFFDEPDVGRERHSELALTVATDFPLNPSFEAYSSLSAERGAYLSGALSHPFRLGAHTVASLEGAVGYNHKMWVEESGFSDVRASVILTFERPARRLAINVSLDYIHGFMPETVADRVVASVGVVSR
jgi:hypothetical protein